MKIVIHERIKRRHPEVSKEDIIDAIENTINWIQRLNHNGEIFGVGVTSGGKFIEYTYMEYRGEILVYHAQYATNNSFKAIGLTNRRYYEDR